MRIRRRTWLLLSVLLLFVLVDGFLLRRRDRYRDETARLRSGMTELERSRTDAIVASKSEQSALILEVMRRQAEGDDALHLAVSTDSGYVALDRGPARLRQLPARLGLERSAGAATDTTRVAVPRGTRVVERLLGPADSYVLPDWLWADRGLPLPEQRAGAGWTGPSAIVISGGTLIYSPPASGPLADSSYVMPGAVRIPADELEAIRANLSPGMRVYFF